MGPAGNFVRSLLFYAVFYTGSLFFVLGAIVALIGSQNLLQVCAHGWARFHNRCARIFLGITVKRVGALTEKPGDLRNEARKHVRDDRDPQHI